MVEVDEIEVTYSGSTNEIEFVHKTYQKHLYIFVGDGTAGQSIIELVNSSEPLKIFIVELMGFVVDKGCLLA